MKRILFLAALLFHFSSFAQNNETGVRTTIEHYFSGVPDRVEKAFHPSATMKYVDYKTGEFKDVPIAEYLGRVRTNYKPEAPRTDKKELVSLNIEGTAAQAKIRIETDKVILYDYMNLLFINGEWKIVSKIFNRADK